MIDTTKCEHEGAYDKIHGHERGAEHNGHDGDRDDEVLQ